MPVKIDPSKERLTEALARLETRDEMIVELNTALTETQEQLESALKDIDFHHHEKERLLSESSFQGESYESVGQQVRAMQAERTELLRQLDSARGQTGLANEAVNRVQALLNDERKANATLRKRQELASLQEQVRVANENIETQERRNDGLERNIQSLQGTIAALKEKIASVQAEVQAAAAATDAERQVQEALRDEVRIWENKYRAEVLASVAAAEKKSEPLADQDYFRPPGSRIQSDDENGNATSSPMASPPTMTASPRTPGTPSGFRTIHGQHRADGSMGGYRGRNASQAGQLDRQYSENLYESSVHDGRNGERSLSAQTSRSDGPSMTGSDEAKPDGPWLNRPKNGERERVQYR